ncbi:MAG TPA: hypothetical protein DDW85_03315 [Porphyromonadaceae bacterium]|nr:hypothetical protein [Porphyromonadaceae bacterium]
MNIDKKYIPKRFRNKKLSDSSAGSTSITNQITSISGETHTHANKLILDQITQKWINVISSLDVDEQGRIIAELANILKIDDDRELSDENILSSLRTLEEIKNAIDGQNLDEKFLSKIKDDTAAGLITFIKGLISNEVSQFLKGLSSGGDITIGDFIGGLTGRGAKIGNNGKIEARSLTLWEFLEVPELRFNRAEVIAGVSWRTKGGGIIESVTMNSDVSGTVTLKLEDGDIGRVKGDDLCMGIWHYESENEIEDRDDGKGNYTFAGFGTSYFRITEVRGERKIEFDFTMRPLDANYTKHFIPQSGMHFAAFGNPTYKDRQNSVYETPEYTRRLVGVTTWEYTKANISMQYGDLTNLSVFGITTGTVGSLYANDVAMTGRIDQSAYVGDELEFKTDNGEYISLNEITTITAYIYNTWDDVTNKYERFDWTRDSGNSVEDNNWNVQHLDYGNVLPVTFDDLPIERVLFTVTAYKPGAEIKGQIIV